MTIATAAACCLGQTAAQTIAPEVIPSESQGVSAEELLLEIESLKQRLASLEERGSANHEPLAPLDSGYCGNFCQPCAEAESPCGEEIDFFCGDCTRCAGYDNGFYVRAPDNAFLARLNGVFQGFYSANWRDSAPVGEDDFEGGFALRRSTFVVSGHAFSPQLNYFVVLQPINSGGSDQVEEAKVYYEFENGLVLQAGRFRDPSFLRELDVPLTSLLGVDRSFVHSVFSTGILEGVAINHQSDAFRTHFIAHDGRGSGGAGTGTDFTTDNTDIALSASVDWKLTGEWAQFGDFTSWSDEGLAVFLGGGFLWEEGETGDDLAANNLNDLIGWTADATVECGGKSLFLAAVGRHSQNGVQDTNQYGFLAQGGIHLVPDAFEAFVRYEYLDFDGLTNIGSGAAVVGDGSVNLLSLGVNRYYHRHGAKITYEVTHAFDPIPLADPFIGVLADAPGADGQTLFRTQLQLAF